MNGVKDLGGTIACYAADIMFQLAEEARNPEVEAGIKEFMSDEGIKWMQDGKNLDKDLKATKDSFSRIIAQYEKVEVGTLVGEEDFVFYVSECLRIFRGIEAGLECFKGIDRENFLAGLKDVFGSVE